MVDRGRQLIMSSKYPQEICECGTPEQPHCPACGQPLIVGKGELEQWLHVEIANTDGDYQAALARVRDKILELA